MGLSGLRILQLGSGVGLHGDERYKSVFPCLSLSHCFLLRLSISSLSLLSSANRTSARRCDNRLHCCLFASPFFPTTTSPGQVYSYGKRGSGWLPVYRNFSTFLKLFVH